MPDLTTTNDQPDVTSERRFEVLCVGSALMDHLGFAELSTLAELGFAAGAMTLADIPTTERIAGRVGADRQVSGGAEANTAVGVASFGARTAYLGAIASDELGERYATDLQEAGVHAVLERIAPDGDKETSTGRCFVLVTPDAERTMITALGASGRLTPQMITAELIGSAGIVYFDSYIFDFLHGTALVSRIIEEAHQAGVAIAFGLADPFAVDRHRDAINSLLASGIHYLFGNESEARSLTGKSTVQDAIVAMRSPGRVSVVTCAADGALVATEHDEVAVPAVPVPEVVDVTGAGDLFTAGVLFGLAKGRALPECAQLGALAASEVISHLGARPERSLAKLAANEGVA